MKLEISKQEIEDIENGEVLDMGNGILLGLKEEENLSECCGAEIIYGLCSDCKEHVE